MFMVNRAKTDFMICQRKARYEFIKCHEFQAKDVNQVIRLKTQQDKFLAWLKEPKTLKRFGYVTGITDNQDELEMAQRGSNGLREGHYPLWRTEAVEPPQEHLQGT